MKLQISDTSFYVGFKSNSIELPLEKIMKSFTKGKKFSKHWVSISFLHHMKWWSKFILQYNFRMTLNRFSSRNIVTCASSSVLSVLLDVWIDWHQRNLWRDREQSLPLSCWRFLISQDHYQSFSIIRILWSRKLGFSEIFTSPAKFNFLEGIISYLHH